MSGCTLLLSNTSTDLHCLARALVALVPCLVALSCWGIGFVPSSCHFLMGRLSFLLTTSLDIFYSYFLDIFLSSHIFSNGSPVLPSCNFSKRYQDLSSLINLYTYFLDTFWPSDIFSNGSPVLPSYTGFDIYLLIYLFLSGESWFLKGWLPK